LQADAGDDQIGFVGESFFINGCGSVFNDQSLCDMAEQALNDFSITWKWNEFVLATDTLGFNLETGDGTLFDMATDYLITLEIIYAGDFNSLRSGDEMRLSLLHPRIISSPGGLLLVVLAMAGLGYLRWRNFWA